MSKRLIVALDYPDIEQALALCNIVGETVSFYKIGLELLFNGGPALARDLKRQGFGVFIDAKLLDIGETVKKATAQIANLEADFLTIHAADAKTLYAAVLGRGQSQLKLLGVTVMTNLEKQDLEQQGISQLGASELVCRRAELCRDAGFDGVIASALEASMVREIVGPDFLIVTPGIRPSGVSADDQKRVMTPSGAIKAGADYLVVGRAITQAPEPAVAAHEISLEIDAALRTRQS